LERDNYADYSSFNYYMTKYSADSNDYYPDGSYEILIFGPDNKGPWMWWVSSPIEDLWFII